MNDVEDDDYNITNPIDKDDERWLTMGDGD